MNQTFWLYDLTVIAIVILCVSAGWQGGTLFALLKVIGYLFASALANVVAEPISEWVYDTFLEDTCSSWIAENLEDSTLGDTLEQSLSTYGITLDDAMLEELAESDSPTEQLYADFGISSDLLEDTVLPSLDTEAASAYTGLPDWMTEALLGDASSTSTEQADQLIQTAALLLSTDSEETANTLTETYVKPVLLSFLNVFVFFVAFLLTSAAIQSIIKLLSFKTSGDGPVAQFNHAIGCILGCCQAVFFLYLMKTLTTWFVEVGSNQLAFFNETAIGKTILFEMLYTL